MANEWIPFEVDFSTLDILTFDAKAPGVDLTEAQESRAREAFFGLAEAELLEAISSMSVFAGSMASEEAHARAKTRVRELTIVGCSPPTEARFREGRLEAPGLRFFGRVTPVAGALLEEAMAAAVPLLTVWLVPNGKTCARRGAEWFYVAVAPVAPAARVVKNFPVELRVHDAEWGPDR